MKRAKGAFVLLLERLALLGDRVRARQRRTGGDGVAARDILDQPPRPVRGDDDSPTVPTPHW
ncbi:hypothetical protein [Streptomyces sp. NBC_01314]|uniref:hypothetical protein n=1 Tax=Streptomyces sp. NBC_01314 TaxID=2903821 RepID=UPI0030891940|nr:hypothetical protein OG622_07075 [Streptomyces sp. NBC_01314]